MGTLKCLTVSAVLITGQLAARAQLAFPPETDLFSDTIVKKLETDPRGMFFRPAPTKGFRRETNLQGFAHALIFNDGRQLRGEITGLTKDEILWQRADLDVPLRFKRSEVRRVILNQPREDVRTIRPFLIPPEQQQLEAKMKAGFATVKLPGDDWLYGELSSADGQTFALKINQRTSFTLGREAISWLYSGPGPAPAFGFGENALGLEGWLGRSTAAQAEVKDSTTTIHGTDWIGRTVPTMRRFELNFEVPEDGEESTRVWLQPIGAKVNAYTTGTVELQLSRTEFRHCIYVTQFEHVNTRIPEDAAEAKGPVRYRVLYDGPGQRLLVFRNGHQLGDWKFIGPKDKQDFGNSKRDFNVNGICFQRQPGARNIPLRLNRVAIQPWDGNVSLENTIGGAGDCLMSADGQLRAGYLGAILNDELTFSGAKLDRKAGMFFQFANDPRPTLTQSDVKLLFGQQGELNVAELEISDGRVRCRTGFAPAFETSVDALQTIAFPKQAGASPLSDASASLVFRNGDELPGALVATGKGEACRWRTASGQEVSFRPDLIAGVRLSGGKTEEIPKRDATVELRNGDRVHGNLKGVSGDKLLFQHGQLGSLELKRDQLWSLYPSSRYPVYEGGMEPETWMNLRPEKPRAATGEPLAASIEGQWLYFDGTFVQRIQPDPYTSYSANNLVAPLSHAPERFEFRCDITHTSGGEPNFSIRLLSKDGDSIQASISNGRANINVFSRKARGLPISRQVLLTEKLKEPTSRRQVRLFVDTKAGTANLFIDGVLITKIGQQAGERIPGLNRILTIQPYQQLEGTLILSSLWLGPWSGELPEAGAESTPAVSLANGDVSTGSAADFKDGKLWLDSEVGPIELPLDKVTAVEFGGTLTTQPAAARIRLRDGSALSVNEFRWDGDTLVAHHDLIGDLRLPTNSISELALNPTPAQTPKLAATPTETEQKAGEDPKPKAAPQSE